MEFKVASSLKGHPNIVEVNSFQRDTPIIIEGQL